MKKSIFFSLLIFTTKLYANPYTDDSSSFFAEALVWELREGSADNWAQQISPAGPTRTAKVLGVPFKLSPGVRLGAVYNSGYADWDTAFTYTWFQTKGVSQATATTGGVYSPFLGNFFINNTGGAGLSGPIYRNASIQWKVLFNICDLEVGRTFQIDQFLSLHPFIGIKGGSINHNINSTWQNPTVATTFTSATENLKNNFLGVGPSLGLNTTWGIYSTPKSSFNIFGNFSGALLWGHWRFKDLYRNNTPTSVAVHVKPINGAATMTRGLMGIEWVGCIAETKMAVRLGYEAQVWFNQMQFYSFNMGRLNNLMSLQGGVLGFEFYF